MTRFFVIVRELRHRPVPALFSLLAIAIAVATLLLSVTALRSFALETERLASEIEERTLQEVEGINNQIRKSMKGLGFNIFIYPEAQELAEVYAQGFATETMPEEYVMRMATSSVVTVNHLLPRLTRKVLWKEQERVIMLIGVRGEVPIMHKDPKKPLIAPVKAGEVVLGFGLWEALGLQEGDRVALNGEPFTVAICHAERGTVDDITAWVALEAAQQMMQLRGRITSILALQCNCASLDRLGEVRREVAAILPGTQVIEKGSRALARAEARTLVENQGRDRVEQLRIDREQRRGDREAFFSVLLPLVMISSVGWIMYLTWSNVRERRSEIGTLRAIGVQGRSILTIVLGKALLLGVAGGVAGVGICAVAAAVFPRCTPFTSSPWWVLIAPGEWLTVLLVTPVVALLASWIPAMQAAQQDPVKVLRDEG